VKHLFAASFDDCLVHEMICEENVLFRLSWSVETWSRSGMRNRRTWRGKGMTVYSVPIMVCTHISSRVGLIQLTKFPQTTGQTLHRLCMYIYMYSTCIVHVHIGKIHLEYDEDDREYEEWETVLLLRDLVPLVELSEEL